MNDTFQKIETALKAMPGQISMYYMDLESENTFSYQENLPLVAASVIKLPMMIALFNYVQQGKADWNKRFILQNRDKVPSCGALTYLHEGLEVTLLDLCTLMIILSDNTATNMIFDFIGADYVNETLESLGCHTSRLRRKMFDAVSSAKGIQNTVTAAEMGLLLKKLYRRECVSPEADEKMISILKQQRLNGKIPFFLHSEYDIAHKTGEDDGVTHDVGIILTPHPFIACFLSNDTNVPLFERCIQDTALALSKIH